MVVDDSNFVRRFYRDALARPDLVIAEAQNGVEALEKLLAEPADLLIVDINMPKMDGLTFLRTLRRHSGAIASIPALVTSTEAAPGDLAAARAAGANYYLVKPVAPETLLAVTEMLCGMK
jgi:two-component system chemotaxis response regulator CheY